MTFAHFSYLFSAVISITLLLLVSHTLKSCLSLIFYSKSTTLNKCKRPPKYPHADPFFGLDFPRKTMKSIEDGNATKTAQSDFEAYGKTFETHILGTTGLQTMDYENLESVANLQFDKFAKASSNVTNKTSIMGDGIIVSNGPIWKYARKTLRPVFYRSHFENFVAFEKYLSMLLLQTPRDGSTVDLQALFREMFDGVSTEYLFGTYAESSQSPHDAGIPERKRFIQCFDKALSESFARIKRGSRVTSILDFFGAEKYFRNSVNELDSYIYKHIDAAIARKVNGKKTNSDVQHSFVFLDELVKETQDRIFIRDQLLNSYFPARDSSAAGASCIFFVLARNPEIWQTLRATVKDIEEPLTLKVLQSLSYIHQVVNEALRLVAPGNYSNRICIEDCTLPRGGGPDGSDPIFVTQGTTVVLNFSVMHHDKAYWGDNADEFCPERWANIDTRTTIPAYMPFLIGPRVCPAQQMLLMQYAYLVVRFTKTFERMDNRDDVLEFVEEHRFTKSSRNGVKVTFVPVVGDTSLGG